MLKRALVIAAIAGFAMALAGPAAMAAASKRTVPAGSVTFIADPVHHQVAQGSRMSAGQKKQWMLLPAVQAVREKAARGR